MIGSLPNYDNWKESVPEIKEPEFNEDELVCELIDKLEEAKKQAELLSEHNTEELFISLIGIIEGQLNWIRIYEKGL